MPAKNSRTSSTARQRKNVSVCTQTDNNFNYEKMILDYEKQIDVLTNRITDYEATVLQLQGENTILKQQNNKFLKRSTLSGLGKNDLVGKITVKEKCISPDIGQKFIKGCSCKGTCASKICGCVKKGTSCNKKLCKCNNTQCRNQEIEKENATDNQCELSQDSHKALEKLGRLSLNQEILHVSDKKKKVLFTECKNVINADKYSESSLSFDTRRRLFTQDLDYMTDISMHESNSQLNDGDHFDKPEILFSHTSIPKRNTRLKNKDERFKFMVTTDKIQNEIQLQSSSDNTDNTNENLLPKIAKVLHSPIEKNKFKAISPNYYIAQRKYKNNKAYEDMAITRLNKEINDKENTEDLVSSSKVQHSPTLSNKHEDIKNDIKNSLLLISNTIDSNNLLDMSLNPMVPKRQLLRSPVNTTGNMILPNESKRFSPPKKELAVAEIDWEQHKSELIMCKICKRKFFPHRIDKHVVSCKGI